MSISEVPGYLRPATLDAVGALKQIRHLKLDNLYFWDGVTDESVRNFSKLKGLEVAAAATLPPGPSPSLWLEVT